MSDIAISVNNIRKSYEVFDKPWTRMWSAFGVTQKKADQEIKAVDGVSFEVKRGEAVAIIGRNGSGKSTLLEMLTGTLSPTAGEVIVNGRVSALLELGSGFNPEYTGRDNVVLNGLLLGLRKRDILDRFNEIEAFADIGSAIDRPVNTYSTGMVMRLAFAVQVLCDPDILIVDEALSVGDFFFQQKCFRLIRKLCENGVTLLFVSHDMGAVRDLCQRGIHLVQGRVGFDGDKIQAIQAYLSATAEPALVTNDDGDRGSATEARAVAQENNGLSLVDPIWSLSNAEMDRKSKLKACIIGVELRDESGHSIRSIRMGSTVIVRVHYQAFSGESPHVNFILKNKHDHIVTAVGSFNHKVDPPSLNPGEKAIFELRINMSFEAGDYVYSLALTKPDASQTSGVVFDETPWIGPTQIAWNYEEQIPPFFGICGMSNSISFDTGSSPDEGGEGS